MYCPPEFWTHVTVTKCKETSATTLRCQADITFAGYTLKKPDTDKFDYPKDRIEVKK